jgi:phosphoribosylformylglycinamidine cyclo-ligase
MDLTYEESGVDTQREERALSRLTDEIKRTWPQQKKGVGTVKLDIGYYANVIDIGGGMGLALSADGVGSKVLIAQMMNRYDTVGIDCVAMNVNDLICVGAKPLSMVDYIAVQAPDPDRLGELAKGLAVGANKADISISGGEIAQLPEIVVGAKGGYAFDLAGAAVGLVRLNRIIVGQDVRDGDVVIGVDSNGIHSNGLTLARKILAAEIEQGLDTGLGNDLLAPTHIYVHEAMRLIEQNVRVKAFAHITSDGLLNLNRVAGEVGFEIETLPSIPTIFSLLQGAGGVDDAEMFRVYNMGIGFCAVVCPEDQQEAIRILESDGKTAHVIGHAIQDKRRRVYIKEYRLVGEDCSFKTF